MSRSKTIRFSFKLLLGGKIYEGGRWCRLRCPLRGRVWPRAPQGHQPARLPGPGPRLGGRTSAQLSAAATLRPLPSVSKVLSSQSPEEHEPGADSKSPPSDSGAFGAHPSIPLPVLLSVFSGLGLPGLCPHLFQEAFWAFQDMRRWPSLGPGCYTPS